jgi:hypothetical protein
MCCPWGRTWLTQGKAELTAESTSSLRPETIFNYLDLTMPAARFYSWAFQFYQPLHCYPSVLFFFFFFFFFLWCWSLNSGPTPQATPPALFLCDGFFQDRVTGTIHLGWLWTSILLISASWVAGITGMSHQLSSFLVCFLTYSSEINFLPLTVENMHFH